MAGTKGNCYLCGAELAVTAMKNHLLKTHGVAEDGQECYLLKITGVYDKIYWLYVDVPLTAALSSVDAFLRKIWLECCGHMSRFSCSGGMAFGKTRKLSALSVGDQLLHEYDFGDTTETILTVAGQTTRPKQKDAVRLLARNQPPLFQCSNCEELAVMLCSECMYDSDTPFFCAACADEHEHDEMLLAVSNSPRMGECGYEGELDIFAFKPHS